MEEKSIYDKVEIIGHEGWTIQWRKKNLVLKDGNVIANSFERGLCEPYKPSYDLEKKEWVFTDHDMTVAPFTDAKVKAIATALWTNDAKTAYKKYVEDTRTPT